VLHELSDCTFDWCRLKIAISSYLHTAAGVPITNLISS